MAGVAYFIHAVFSGLKKKIDALQSTVDEQKKTLEAVRERADEYNRLSKGYKQALDDFENMGKKIDDRRKELVIELEQANQKKDQELIQYRELELQELDLQKKSLDAIPDLEKRLKEVIGELESKIEVLDKRRFISSSFINPYSGGLLGARFNSSIPLTSTSALLRALSQNRQKQPEKVEDQPQYEDNEDESSSNEVQSSSEEKKEH